MADWGMQRQADDLRIALGVARFISGLMGAGFEKLILCDYSTGVCIGFALLNDESQMPCHCTHVKGFIPVDTSIGTDDIDCDAVMAENYQHDKDLYDSGKYQEENPHPIISSLAKNTPDDPSPVIPGLANWQAALFFGTGNLFDPKKFIFLPVLGWWIAD